MESIPGSVEWFKKNAGYNFSKDAKGKILNWNIAPGPGTYNNDEITSLAHQKRGYSLPKD